MKSFTKKALGGGFVAAIVIGAGTFIIGEVSGYKAEALLGTALNAINVLCNTVILASSTILALMLTLLSLSRAANSKLNKEHYHRVLTLAKADTILIITAIFTFLMLNLPILESEGVPRSWYSIIYYVSLCMNAILGGGFIAVVTMLYTTIANVILIVGYRMEDHPLVDHEDVDKAKSSAAKSNRDSKEVEDNEKAGSKRNDEHREKSIP